MRNIFLLLVLSFIIPIAVWGQDIIYRSNKTIIRASILDWNFSRVRYMKWEQPDSSIYYLRVSAIDSIVFLDGKIERFRSLDSHFAGSTGSISMKRNYIGIGLIDPVLYSNIRFMFERRFGAGSFSFYIPLSIGFKRSDMNYTELSTAIYSGLGLNFFPPFRSGVNRYSIGLTWHTGKFYRNTLVNHYTWDLQSTRFWTITNTNSIRFPIGKIFIALGLDVHIVGYFKEFDLFLAGFEYFQPVIRFDLIYNF